MAANTYVLHEVLPVRFGLSLPEEDFQEMFTLVVDGRVTSGASELANLRAVVIGTGRLSESAFAALEVVGPVFSGFEA